MKTAAHIFFGIGLFFLVGLVAYFVCSLAFVNDGVGLFNPAVPIEPAGATVLALAIGMAWFPAFYFYKASKNAGGTLPEDNLEAKIEDADPDYGWYSPWSWWPFALSLAAGVIFLGLAVGTWMTIIGGVLLIVAVIGFSFENHRNRLAH
ncbi:aa3-type cytochrome oxidase subunit IV [Pseudoclavibacter sp. 13-3]|uniref:aa3-type cytochrome oxidase subunit IV n=1 Tax=Pseudoclavibacter sp. 13-3 TaxID=2901228 RepID=UPI001E5E418B|nr:cytochrome c oxidase subunit 4 [Pseudoclavibacter sp. 13-3]MCD7102030.1 cytochrome c oxidase subunit 4 [Pseudoclavibacter sp. 13-3]